MLMEDVARALRDSWGPDTCAPEDIPDWTPGNPARGQCATSAIVLHDYVGGSLVQGEVHVDGVRVDFHWWNRLPDGSQVDVTREQFAPHEQVVGGVDVERPTGATRLDREQALLASRVADLIGRPTSAGPTTQGQPPAAVSGGEGI